MDTRATLRLKADAKAVPFGGLCREDGISPNTGHRWIGRFCAGRSCVRPDLRNSRRWPAADQAPPLSWLLDHALSLFTSLKAQSPLHLTIHLP